MLAGEKGTLLNLILEGGSQKLSLISTNCRDKESIRAMIIVRQVRRLLSLMIRGRVPKTHKATAAFPPSTDYLLAQLRQ